MKVLKSLLLVLSLLFVGVGASAQNKISAALVDASSGEPLGYVTVSLYKSGQEKPLKYALSDEKGKVTIESVSKGEYSFKAELLGYKPYTVTVKMESASKDLGTIKMTLDSEQLDAASVSAVGNPIIVKKDTIEFNASSFKTTDNDVLEDLLKKLPGVEVSEDGSVTVNGESISKITIDGKTFFLDDPQLATKNIPAKMVNKLKVIQKKSEQAEFTGIDDGEEETVIDLSVQPGMMKGLLGNVQAGVGYDIPSQEGVKSDVRYQGNAFIGRFTEDTQLSLILNGNNTNNRGATNRSGNMMMGMMGGGGMGRGQGGWGGGNGITTSYMGGVNGAWTLFDGNMELGGNYLYNASDNDVEESSVKTTYLTDHNLIYNSAGVSNTHSDGHRFGVRLEHKFSENTSILFEPSVNFGTGHYTQSSRDTTYSDYFTGSQTKLNDAYTDNSGNNRNASAGGFLLFRQRLGLPGRTMTAMFNFDLSSNVMDGINSNGTNTYNADGTLADVSKVNQSFNNQQKSYNLFGNLTYTEPLGNHFYVEANYSYSWNKSTSEKETVDMETKEVDYNYSNRIINENVRQEIGINALYQDSKFRAQVGFSAMPTKTYNSTTKYNSTDGSYTPQEYDDFRWNFSPQAMMFMDLNDNLNWRLFYRGESSQPSTSQLMPVPDNTDPLNISFGNPTLTPYFSHSLRGDLRYSNREKFASFNLRFNGEYTQNPIVNTTWYGTNGGQYTMPFNGPSNSSASANMFGNLPLGNSGVFSISNSLGVNWRKSSSYVGTNVDMSKYESDGYYEFMEWFIEQFNDPDYYAAHITENTTRTLSANDRLRFTYRGTALEASVGGSTRMNRSWYSISTLKDNTTTWNNQINASLTWNWTATGISLESDFDYNWYRGYSTEQPSQYVLNAEISKLLFNNNMTIALRGYDILGQSKNLTVTDSSNYHSEAVNNTLGRYVVVSLTWRFGSMGGRRRGGGGPDGGGPGGPGGGGPGGPPPMM
jgi:5-hydroxyisourate hydrolase-like protein (transthyretin family)